MLIVTLLCGLAAAALRGFQLVNSFDPDTGLIEPGDPATVALIALSALFAVLAAVYVAARRGRQMPDRPLGKIWIAVELAALAALFAAAAIDVITGFTDIRVSLICLGVLGLFAGGALLMISLSINRLAFTSVTGFWATVPVFWACLMLIIEFWGHAGNPVRSTYVYGMFATIFCTLALYTVAGSFFNRARPGRSLLYALPGIYFSVLTLGGAVLGRLTGDPIVTLPPSSLLRHAFIALHLSAVAAAVLYGRFTPPPEEEPEGDAAAGAEEEQAQ